jgi:hypothetical protein
MIHIRQKNSSFNPNEAYTLVITSDWDGTLETHPSMVDRPDFFEIADCDIPEHTQFLIYEKVEQQK